MKAISIFIMLLLSGLTMVGQITIVNDDLAPVGTTVLMANDTASVATITPGPSGADLTWDYSALVVNTVDTVSMLLPSNTPYGADFPFANFTIAIEADGSYAYFSRNTSVLTNIGAAGDSGDYGIVSVPITPGNIYLDFPVNYGNSRDEEYYFKITIPDNSLPGVDSIRYKSATVEHLTVDAWGTLKLPVGNFEALRQKEEKVVYDSIWSRFFGNWILLTSGITNTNSYYWWTNDIGAGFTLCSMDQDPQTLEISGITFLNSYSVNVETLSAGIGVSLFPNPASEYLTVNGVNSDQLDKTEVISMSGKIMEIPCMKKDVDTYLLDIRNLKSGNYLLRLLYKDGTSSSYRFIAN